MTTTQTQNQTIPPGNDLKFRVTSEIAGFSMGENDFKIVIKNRWWQVLFTIPKDECFQDTEDRWYFTLENVQTSVYFSLFIATLPDDDYDKQTRIRTDLQHLATVGTRCCNTTYHNCSCDHDVHYEQVWSTNIDGAAYLCDKDGNLILTADGKRIQFKKPQNQDNNEEGND